MVLTTVYIGNVLALKSLDLDGAEDNGIVLASVGLDSQFAKVV